MKRATGLRIRAQVETSLAEAIPVGAERRKDKRTRCFIPCDVQWGGKSYDGTVRDVSAGGLSLEVPLDLDQGDVIDLVLRPDQLPEIPVQAIVWHQRRVRQRQSGRQSARLGMVLSDAPDDFAELLGLTPAPARRAAQAVQAGTTAKLTKPAKKPESAAPPPAPEAAPRTPPPAPSPPPAASVPIPEEEPTESDGPGRFRVRVKMDQGPRSRSILVFAAAEAEARESAIAETGSGWSILEVEPA